MKNENTFENFVNLRFRPDFRYVNNKFIETYLNKFIINVAKIRAKTKINEIFKSIFIFHKLPLIRNTHIRRARIFRNRSYKAHIRSNYNVKFCLIRCCKYRFLIISKTATIEFSIKLWSR